MGSRVIVDQRSNAASVAWPDMPPPWCCAYGDDTYGLWAEFEVEGQRQRMRWIEPGVFMMGSPQTEKGRVGDEGPQHPVRITRGFWLADTACTQALWLAVMGGKNPSRFDQDAQAPVEQVSWDDVKGFLERISSHAPGAQAALPTEAEWEYACRAGSQGPFSFGDTVTTDQVNFDGNSPYGSAPKGAYRERTVAVKALPANRWGLHQMHGNVWEWCADPMREYRSSKTPIDDPGLKVGQRAAPRAVRGGSWFLGARNALSASRNARERSDRDVHLGFRLALRS